MTLVEAGNGKYRDARTGEYAVPPHVPSKADKDALRLASVDVERPRPVPSQAAVNRAETYGGTPEEVERTWARWRQENREVLGEDPVYVHFTSEEHAKAISESLSLGTSRSIVDTVYAVPVGGSNVPGVQQGSTSDSGFGVVSGARTHAVVFRAAAYPETLYPEECIWRRCEPLDLVEAEVMTTEEAAEFLDGSLQIED